MNIQFCGAAKTVTGSCYVVNVGKTKFLVDCGAFQGPDDMELKNYNPFPFDPKEIDYVFLTHAHFDHCGRLPLLIQQGFRGKIICTKPTKELAQLVLLDAAKVQEEDYRRISARLKNSPGFSKDSSHSAEGNAYAVREPLYSESDVYEVMKHFEVYSRGESITVNDHIEFRMRDSGHILGSVFYEFWLKNENNRVRKVVFSGDLGQTGQRIVQDPDLVREADYVVVESTYGDRLHRSKDETVLEFLSILKKAKQTGGNIIIPVFAIERAQEIIYELNMMVEHNLLENLTFYLDSPMGIKATEIFRKYPEYYDEDAKRLLAKGDDPFNFRNLFYVNTHVESMRLIEKRNVVFMAGSGMCTGGRVVNHLINNIEKDNTNIIIVGYQVKGTLGRKLVDAEPVVRIRGKNYTVRAKVHTLNGFSAHADERDLRYWLRSFGHSPKTIFIVHGDEQVSTSFAMNIKQELMIDTHVPNMNEIVELE
jgi:metallo-beta-lactamase family protein